MNLKRWRQKEGFKRRVECRLQMIGGSGFTGGASAFFQISHFIVVYNKRKRALGSRLRVGWTFQLDHPSKNQTASFESGVGEIQWFRPKWGLVGGWRVNANGTRAAGNAEGPQIWLHCTVLWKEIDLVLGLRKQSLLTIQFTKYHSALYNNLVWVVLFV